MLKRIFLPTTLAFALTALTACGDEVTDPGALMESAEAEAVMRSAEALPSLASISDAVTPATDRELATLVRARELWDGGAVHDDPRGAARRRLAVGYALPVLVERMPAGEWTLVRERMEDWVATAEATLQHLRLPTVEYRLKAADHYLDRSAAASTDRARVRFLLLAGSELVETTPRWVAQTTTAEAQTALERAESREPALPERTLERAGRLKDWAVQAVSEGEYLLAIQRAYYAIQLVEEP